MAPLSPNCTKKFLYILFLFAPIYFSNIVVAQPTLGFNLVVQGLSSPVDIRNAGDSSNRLFIVEQPGTIRIYKNGTLLTKPFLDVSTLVRYRGGEQGLLSLAFHPNYKSNGTFYVYYVNTSGNLVLARFQVSSISKNVANQSSEKILLTIDHPNFSNHNGGRLAFGKDGFLYLPVGDGGSGGDPNNNAQNLQKSLGKILRLNVSNTATFKVPSTNPFVNASNANKLIWAYGLRNPWRYSFDRLTGDMYVGDVGPGDV